MQGHKNWVLCLAWSPDGQMVASGGMEGALWLWDPKTGKPLGCCKGETPAVASPCSSFQEASVSIDNSQPDKCAGARLNLVQRLR